jgi:glycosyltransferase involved in cell wall biosynthesis
MLAAGLRDAGIDVVRAEPTIPALPNLSYRALGLIGRDLGAFLTNYPLWSRYPKADIYHLTTQTLAPLLLLCRPKGRVVVTVHDLFPYMLRHDHRLRSPYVLSRLYHRLAMAGLKRADHLIAVSEYTRKCLVEYLDIRPEKITVVYHGIDHDRFRRLTPTPATRERYGLTEGRRYLIYVGSEDPRKNLGTLLGALARLRRELSDVELIKVGRAHFEGERLRLLALASELGVQGAVRFLDDVSENDLPLLYNAADLFVTPSLYEGFGFPVLEAMACGTPVVCAKAGSLPEIVGSAGVQVSPCNVDTLSKTLTALLTNKEKRTALQRDSQKIAAEFTWSAAVQSTAAVYETTTTNGQILSS